MKDVLSLGKISIFTVKRKRGTADRKMEWNPVEAINVDSAQHLVVRSHTRAYA